MKAKDPDLSLSLVKAQMSYDPETGIFRRLKTMTRAKAGERCDYPEPTGYRRVRVGGHAVYAHRLAWFYVHGFWPKLGIDHINQDRKDNRIENLRDVSHKENCANRPGLWGRVPLKGVRLSSTGTRFMAQIAIDGRSKYLGSFKTAEAAHQAYLDAASDLRNMVTNERS